MTYREWESGVPAAIREDRVWRIEAYRLSLFASDIGWHDVTKLLGDRRTRRLSDQLYRSLGSISANVEEGFSRRTGKDRAHFYGYALGSARESRGWYFKGRHVLGEPVSLHRMDLLTQIIRLLLTMASEQRRRGATLQEPTVSYDTPLPYDSPVPF
ncbi:MAG: four helix bundle protein [Bacteroidota bacterium]